MGDFLTKILAWFLAISAVIGMPLLLLDAIWNAITGHGLFDKECHFFDDDDSDNDDSSH